MRISTNFTHFSYPFTNRKRRKKVHPYILQFLNVSCFLLYVSVCSPAYMYVHNVHVWCPQRSKEEISSPETEVLDAYENQNPGTLQEQHKLLNVGSSL